MYLNVLEFQSCIGISALICSRIPYLSTIGNKSVLHFHLPCMNLLIQSLSSVVLSIESIQPIGSVRSKTQPGMLNALYVQWSSRCGKSSVPCWQSGHSFLWAKSLCIRKYIPPTLAFCHHKCRHELYV